MFVSAILAAGGRGARLGAATPKQLLALGDCTILQRSFETLAFHHAVDEIVVALPADRSAAPPQFLALRAKPVRVVSGGARRQGSVGNAFARILPLGEIVVICAASRPCGSPSLVTIVIEAAYSSGAA